MSGVLVLGGTGEARELAAALHGAGGAVTTSLAGRVPDPHLPPGEVRIGGFGGAHELGRWLTDHRTRVVVDATHPFAGRISHQASEASHATGVPLIRLERAPWQPEPGDHWIEVEHIAAAAAEVPRRGSRVLLTTGRQEIAPFASLAEPWFLIRSIAAPGAPLPPRHELLLERGPFSLGSELELIERHRIDLLVTKNSGGPQTAAKLTAARQRGVPVVMVRRPRLPEAPTARSVADTLRRLESLTQ